MAGFLEVPRNWKEREATMGVRLADGGPTTGHEENAGTVASQPQILNTDQRDWRSSSRSRTDFSNASDCLGSA